MRFSKNHKIKALRKKVFAKTNHMKFNTLLYKGWKKAGVARVVKGGTVLPPEDSFEEIDNVLQL